MGCGERREARSKLRGGRGIFDEDGDGDGEGEGQTDHTDQTELEKELRCNLKRKYCVWSLSF